MLTGPGAPSWTGCWCPIRAGPHPAGVAGGRAGRATPAAVKAELEKLAYLRGMDADTLDLSVLPAERRRFLAGLGRRLTAQNLARRDDDRKYPILLTLAAQSAVDVLDEVLLLFDQALSGREAAARERLTKSSPSARRRKDRQSRWTTSWRSCSTRTSPMTRSAGGCGGTSATSGCGRRGRPVGSGCPVTTGTWR